MSADRAAPPAPDGDGEVLLSSLQVCALSGASYRQLDYWSRTGALVPYLDARGSGTQRRWTVEQACIVRVAVSLAAHGAGRDVLAAAAATLAGRPGLWDGPLLVTSTAQVLPVAAGLSEGWVVDAAAARATVLASLAAEAVA